MDGAEQRDLERTIDTTLGEEPLRPVPAGFGRTVQARVTILTLIKQERQRLGYAMAASGALYLPIVAAGLLLALFPELPGLLVRNVPGAMGFYDYLMASPAVSPPRILAALLILPAVPLGASVVAAFRQR